MKVNRGNRNVTHDLSTPWPDLDGVDLAMIGALQVDGRASMASMAKTLGLSVGTVRHRYERLRRRGLVHAVALVDPAIVGRHVVAHLEVVVRVAIRSVAQRLAALDGVAWLALGADAQTIYLQVSTATNAELAGFVNERIRSLDGVTRVRTFILLRNWSPVFTFGGTGRRSDAQAEADALWRRGDDSVRPVDELDLMLLRCLERDARVTITAIAEQVGLSVPATRQRLVKLRGEGTVRFRTRPNPLADGIKVARLVVDIGSDSTKVAQSLAAVPNVSYVSESSGDGVLTAELICGLEEQIWEGHERASELPGVIGVRLVRYGAVLLHTGHW